MREIQLKFGGSIFIEELDNLDECDRVRIFDSNKKNFQNIPIEILKDKAKRDRVKLQKFFDNLYESFCKIETLDELLRYLDIASFISSKHWVDLLEDGTYDNEDEKDKAYQMSKEEFVESFSIFKIGEYYVLLK